MKKFKVPSSGWKTPTFPTAVAMCAVRKALRPFLNRPDARFKALLQMPSGVDTLFYHHAVVDLLEADGLYDEHGKDLLFVARLDEIAFVNSLRKISEARRVVLLCADLEALDRSVRLVADLEIVLDNPRSAHFLAASRISKLQGMTTHDADFLAGQDFNRVKMAVNGNRSLGAAIGRLRRAAAEDAKKDAKQPVGNRKAGRTLHETSGYGEAAVWGIRLSEDVAAWRAGQVEWEDVDRGAVLYGRPGTGKTTYGRALAATCGIPIIEASSARWQATGHLGDMLKAMRKTFEVANRSAPCILFLDEFDAFGDRGSNTAGDNLDYKRQVINALLECLDPPGGRPGVVVVAATNNPELIDPALLRPGRLERLIEIPLPDGAARLAILRQHLRGLPAPDDMREFQESTLGYAGADLELVAREVRRRIRKERRAIEERDLLNALPPRRPLSDLELRRVAVHEAGHALVAAVASPDEVLSVVVSKMVALDDAGSSLGHVEYRRKQSVFETEDSFTSRIDIHLAGIAAERLVFGHHSTSGGGARTSDLHVATDLATTMERYFGFGECLVMDLGRGAEALENLRAGDPRLWRSVDRRLRTSLKRVEAMLLEYRLELEQLAEWLVERGRVSGAEVSALLSLRHGGPVQPTVIEMSSHSDAAHENDQQEPKQ